MPTSLEYLHQAQFRYDGAYHLLKVTFPIVKDPKLFLGILDNISNSLESGMNAVLNFERQLQLVPAFSDDFQSRFSAFCRSAKRHNLPTQHLDMILKIRKILDSHKKSPVEFHRGEKMVICNDNYHELQVISTKDLQMYLKLTRDFLEKMECILNRKE